MNINDRSKYIETNTVAEARIIRPDGSAELRESDVVLEHSMNIHINGQLALRLVCTPNDLTELVIGRLITGGYIHSTDDIETLSICEYGRDARVFLAGSGCEASAAGVTPSDKSKGSAAAAASFELVEAAAAAEPTCCTDNRVLMLPRHDGAQTAPLKKAAYRPEWIFSLAAAFKNDSRIHSRTAGTHSCYLASGGEILYSAEDIGRHNALDKAVGHAALSGLRMSDCMLFTTGRVPADMTRKVIISGIPVLVSKSVPTTASIELARQYGLNLICRAWPDSYEIFNENI